MDVLWKIWYDYYVLSLREGYQLRIEELKKRSNCKPKVGEMVHIKEDFPQGKRILGKLEPLIQSNDGEVSKIKDVKWNFT